MLQVQTESAKVSDLQRGRRLVGSWTLDLTPHAGRNVVPRGPSTQSLKSILGDSATRKMLILVWSLQS